MRAMSEAWYNELRQFGDTIVQCKLEYDADYGPVIWLQSNTKLNSLRENKVVFRAHDNNDANALGQLRLLRFLSFHQILYCVYNKVKHRDVIIAVDYQQSSFRPIYSTSEG